MGGSPTECLTGNNDLPGDRCSDSFDEMEVQVPEQPKPQEGSGRASGDGIPPRSIFYPLEARARNTPLVESLTGYLRRLACAHGVSVTDLICHAHFDDLFPQSVDRRRRRHLFQAQAYQLDGSESFGQRWISRLEAGTARCDLHNSTLWPFVDGDPLVVVAETPCVVPSLPHGMGFSV